MAVALCLYAKVIIKSGASSSVGFADTFPHLGKANSVLCALHSALYPLCTRIQSLISLSPATSETGRENAMGESPSGDL